jgi:sugar phosphate isomerase/epimerase
MRRDETISIQLYSLRAIQPLEARLAIVAELGFQAIEPPGALFADPVGLKRALAHHELAAPSAHVGLPDLRSDAAGMARLCRGLGVATIFVPAPPRDTWEMDSHGWQRLAHELVQIGRAVRGEGLALGWHNHDFEFKPTSGGAMPMDIILNEAVDLAWQVDLAWLIRAGEDPLIWLRRYAGRVTSCHVKDMAKPGADQAEEGWADLGHGELDWAKLLPAMRAAGAKLFVLEHDNPSDPVRFARNALATIKSWQ